MTDLSAQEIVARAKRVIRENAKALAPKAVTAKKSKKPVAAPVQVKSGRVTRAR